MTMDSLRDSKSSPAMPVGHRQDERIAGGGWPALITAGLSVALILIDGFIISVATPEITQAFAVSIDRMGWLVGAYALPLAVAPVIFGAAGDRFGLKRLFFAGVMLLMLGSIFCALSQDVFQLTLARLLQGTGAAMLSPQTLVVASRALGTERRGFAIGVWGAISSLGLLLGPVIGGAVLAYLPWHWIFLINLPLGVMALVAFAVTVPERRDSAAVSVRALPIRSICLLLPAASAIVLSLGALFHGEVTGIAGVLIGVTLFTVWIRREASTPDDMPSLIGQTLLRNSAVSKAAMAAFAINASTAGTVAVLTTAIADTQSTTPAITTALIFLPAMLLVACAMPFTGKMAQSASASGHRLVVIAGLLAVISPLLIGWSVSNASLHIGICTFAIAVQGLAGAVLISFVTVAAMVAGGAQRAGAASGVVSMARNLGTAIGAAGLTGAMMACGSPAWAFIASSLFATLSLPFCILHLHLTPARRSAPTA